LNRKITWDEVTIAEHDLDRGTRQKIEEPETPYHYPESDEEEEEGCIQ
jgi:protein phosphatase inhibitor 2